MKNCSACVYDCKSNYPCYSYKQKVPLWLAIIITGVAPDILWIGFLHLLAFTYIKY